MKDNNIELALKLIAEMMVNNQLDYFETTIEVNNKIVKLFIEAESIQREN